MMNVEIKKGEKMKNKEIQTLTIGSKYQITSLGSKDTPIVTNGEFLGFSILGSSEALCLKLDKSHKKLSGKIRMIPSHMIMTLDVITEVKDKKKSDEETTARSYL